ncbi:hypothetical protein [Novosphingobium mangrovi (ex Huang et al. 2023)]|uniref:Uncharacterized protein n=1 Tax=Novosphingobium mangrovi (ex Huang et al. 2023) TaxID=2976432 RepID=A0ABT2IA75_9SPHN|nr:hypothetical protein [Novosphingobium mangrovi (ex Huang et al. 2023)]MCT2401703.1 hypothetical protein [Novosphingobium mangrovi (ex Huang et al. 2023)]
MVVGAMLWSALLINVGMIGIAIEAVTGRVLRAWLIVPVAFYGGYLGFAAYDRHALSALRQSYEAGNEKVRVPFHPDRQALVFENGGSPSWYTQNYALPVAYSENANHPEGYRSTRMVAQDVCTSVRNDISMRAAGVKVMGFHDGDAIGGRTLETRFCDLSMPEAPQLPQVRVGRREAPDRESLLPVRKVTTTITTPEGRSFVLRGGSASPLSWIPLPFMGCGLNSGNPSWDCDWGFWRNSFTPILPGRTRHGRDLPAIARALGLKPVSIADRSSAELPAALQDKMNALKVAALKRQLANLDAMIANPMMDHPDWNTGVLANDPETLAARADDIMTGLERAAAIDGTDRYKARESGRILARLIAALPPSGFMSLKPRILDVYRKADDDHWLWKTETLIRRLGDLGVDAMPYLIRPRASNYNVNGAGIEGMCRVGIAGHALAAPVLLGMWNSSRDGFDRDRRAALYVAMRRMGIVPPPLPQDKRDQFSRLRSEWSDISPQSPPTVCATREEARSRRMKATRERR